MARRWTARRLRLALLGALAALWALVLVATWRSDDRSATGPAAVAAHPPASAALAPPASSSGR